MRSARKRPKFEDMLLDLVMNAGGDPQAIRERDWRRVVKSNQGHIRRASRKVLAAAAERVAKMMDDKPSWGWPEVRAAIMGVKRGK